MTVYTCTCEQINDDDDDDITCICSNKFK